MKPASLLIITQVLDRQDPVLGFFHRWVEELAACVDRVTVICLKKGDVNVPANVRVHSLGKEAGIVSSWRYAWRFLQALVACRGTYRTVFVHMNQEYVLLAGCWWRLVGTRILLWRNHPSGSWQTRLAVRLAHQVFCTSRQSFTAKFAKTKRMPVGIVLPTVDVLNRSRLPNAFLSLGRLSPVKRLELIVAGFAAADLPVDAHLDLVGDPIPRPIDLSYAERLDALIATADPRGACVKRLPGVPPHEALEYFARYGVFINATEPGSFDKTILEAAAQGCLPLVAQDIFQGTEWVYLSQILTFSGVHSLSRALERLSRLSDAEQDSLRRQLRAFIERHHSLDRLIQELLPSL